MSWPSSSTLDSPTLTTTPAVSWKSSEMVRGQSATSAHTVARRRRSEGTESIVKLREPHQVVVLDAVWVDADKSRSCSSYLRAKLNCPGAGSPHYEDLRSAHKLLKLGRVNCQPVRQN